MTLGHGNAGSHAISTDTFAALHADMPCCEQDKQEGLEKPAVKCQLERSMIARTLLHVDRARLLQRM